jgi:hypothetical protein
VSEVGKSNSKEIDDYIFVKTDGKNNFEKSMAFAISKV